MASCAGEPGDFIRSVGPAQRYENRAEPGASRLAESYRRQRGGEIRARPEAAARGIIPCMDERDFYNEKEETKQLTLVCPHCRQEGSYPIRWKVRTKKDQLPRGAGNEDRRKFEKARTYMVRVDDLVACRNLRCRKRFELTGQTVVLL